MTSNCKRMEMVDMVCKVQTVLEVRLPFKWVSLAVDVAELFASSKAFVEQTEEAKLGVACYCMFKTNLISQSQVG